MVVDGGRVIIRNTNSLSVSRGGGCGNPRGEVKFSRAMGVAPMSQGRSTFPTPPAIRALVLVTNRKGNTLIRRS